MNVIEYGKENKEVIMLLHGGGLSHWNFRKEAELLKEKFHVVLPILDGHSNCDFDFTSIEDNAQRIIDYIDVKFGGSILLLGGLSLGAQIAVEILSKRNNIAQHAIIESVSLISSKLTHVLLKPSISMSYGLIKKKWFSKWQFKSLHINKEYFDDYYADSCGITKANMIAFLKANTKYEPKEELKNCQIKTRIIVGGKETRKMKKSAKLLYSILQNSSLEMKPKYHHGDYSLNHADEYVSDLLNFLL